MLLKPFIANTLVVVRNHDKPWYSGDLRRMKRRVNRIHKRAKLLRYDWAWANYRNVRNGYIQNCRDAEKQYDITQIAKLSQCSFTTKECWKLFRSVLGLNAEHNLPPLLVGNNIVTENKAKADIFNTLFLEKSSIDDQGRVPPDVIDGTIPPADILDNIIITHQDVDDQFSLLNISKAYGPDGIGPRLLKIIWPSISDSMFCLFRASLDQMKIPSIWKNANVVPVYKKGDKSDPANYRPISLLNTSVKMVEKILFKYIFNHFRKNSTISKWQSGFMPGCSTTCQLLEIYHQFCENFDEGKEIRVVFLDISRAFDRVWHAGLLKKLAACGIRGALLDWLADYLHDRQQRVCLNGEFSDWGVIRAGIPQGSILGPLLFLIFINDITEVVNFTKIRLFADDTCLFITVDNRQQAKQCVDADLNAIHEWSLKWLVSFSVPKTKSLIVSQKRDFRLNPPLHMNNTVLDEVDYHKHLGITFSNNLSWGLHIDEICKKAMQRLDVIQSFKFKMKRNDLERFYLSFVLPILEYCDILWDGAPEYELNKLDRIQLRAMRIITGATERCDTMALYTDLGWHSLAMRRKLHRLNWFYKIHNNLAPAYLSDLIPPTVAERHEYGLRNRRNITAFRTNKEQLSRSFFPSTVRDWNALPIELRNAHSLHIFKRSLHAHFAPPPKIPWYGRGDRLCDIHHARMRVGCSKLKAHLFYNLHVENSSSCICGHLIEDTSHYFLQCPLYRQQRYSLNMELNAYQPLSNDLLLYGSNELSLDDNTIVVLAVQNFIRSTKRFF